MSKRKTIFVRKGVLVLVVVVLLIGLLIPSNEAANSYFDGSVLFNDNGDVSEDNNNLFWDNSSKELGIGTNDPRAKLDVRGSATFNDDGDDSDFRVESDNTEYMFFIDSSNNRVHTGGVGNSGVFNVYEGSLTVESDGGKFYLWEDDVAHEDAQLYLSNAAGAPNVFLPLISMKGNTADGCYLVADTTTDTGLTALLRVSGRANGGTVTSRPLFMVENLYAWRFIIDKEGNVQQAGGLTVNENSGDYDTRIESDNDANMIFVDAGNDRVGIGTDTPLHKLHIHQDFGPTMVRVSSNDNMVWITADTGANMPSGFGMLEEGVDKAYVYWDGVNDYLSLWEPGNNTLICKDGKVGIGTTSPSSALHVVGKATFTGGVDPPYLSFSHETHQSIRKFAKNVDEHEKVMQFWNGDAHQMEVYVISEDAFYTITGELVEN